MKVTTDDYTLEIMQEENKAVITGLMRPATPTASDEVFKDIKNCLESNKEKFILDVSGLSFMNSSGITSLARVIMHAKEFDREILCIIDNSVLWQRKTLNSLHSIWSKFIVQAKEQ